MMMGMAMPMPESQGTNVNPADMEGGTPLIAQGAAKMDVTGGRGYGSIQRAINQAGYTRGIL